MARKRPAMLSGRLLGYSGALVTALLSAALVDEAIEWLSNAGVLGGSAADVHQEMAAPSRSRRFRCWPFFPSLPRCVRVRPTGSHFTPPPRTSASW